MTIDLARLRAETPGVQNVAHFNNAGSALPPNAVVEAQINHLQLEAAIGGYEAANQESARVAAVYDSVARLINAKPQEIAVVENATVAWDMAFYALKFEPGDRILTAEAEYAANYVAYLQVAKRTGAVVEVIPSAPTGETSPDALAAMMDDRVKLVSITHVPTNGGLVNPAAEIGRIAKRHGALYLLDACQSVGQMPVDVAEIQCDMLSATGRKYLRGPRGVGFLYVRESLIPTMEPPIIDHFAANWTGLGSYELRPDARRFENWENNYAAKLGLGAAVDYALDIGMDAIWERVRLLADDLRRRLRETNGITVRDIGQEQGGIVTFSSDHEDSADIKQRLASQGINISVSGPSSTLIDSTRRNLPPICRASVHYYNDEAEIDRLMAALRG
jgi:cysteine desulfurase / selenocysteine lyase